MKKLAVALFASALSLTAVPAFAWDQSSMNAQVDQTNFSIDGDCSGTLIDLQNGYILTANHCVDQKFDTVEKQEIDQKTGEVKTIKVKISRPGTASQITFDGGNPVASQLFKYTVKAHDADHDLALIQLHAKLPNTIVAPVATDEPVRGDHVWAVGNPFGVLYSTVTDGRVSSVQRDYRMIGIDRNSPGDELDNQPGDNVLLQHTAPIAPGNSGGALYNDKGELIGVNVRGAAIGNIALAVTLDDVRKFLTDNGVTLPTPVATN